MGRESDIAAVIKDAADQDQWRVVRHICRRYRRDLLTREEARQMLEMLGVISPGYVWVAPPSDPDKRRKILIEDYEEMLRQREERAAAAKAVPEPTAPDADQAEEVSLAIGLLQAGLPYLENAS